ncbi:MAG TPA: hypothetical protein VMV69_12315 [Pirellulales bacterium]|nr:hypothetical protein [Pirellulales bacterium]
MPFKIRLTGIERFGAVLLVPTLRRRIRCSFSGTNRWPVTPA